MRFEPILQRRRLGIGLTPLIDVVFILLLFFMLASSLTRIHAVPMATHAERGARSLPGAEGPDPLRLRIREDGVLELGGSAIEDEALVGELVRHRDAYLGAGAGGDGPYAAGLVVEAADSVALQRLITVLDIVAEARLPVLSLQ